MKRLVAICSLVTLLAMFVFSCKPAQSVPTGGNTPLNAGNQTAPSTQTPPPSANPMEHWVGNTTPELSLNDLNGNTVSLSDYKGKVVWLNFWATW